MRGRLAGRRPRRTSHTGQCRTYPAGYEEGCPGRPLGQGPGQGEALRARRQRAVSRWGEVMRGERAVGARPGAGEGCRFHPPFRGGRRGRVGLA